MDNYCIGCVGLYSINNVIICFFCSLNSFYAAIGTTFFAVINPTLCGDIAVSLLTLLPGMTFLEWTELMYETMVVYSLSCSYYISFIFFTAFTF